MSRVTPAPADFQGKATPMSTDKPVVVYGASGYTGQLICEYLREFNVPFIAAGRDKARIAEALDTVPGIDTVPHEVVEVEHQVGPLTELLDGAQVVLQHGRAVRPVRQRGSRGLPGHRLPLPRHHRRAGLADPLRRGLRRADGGAGAAAGAGRRADVHHRRDRGPALPGDAGPGHAGHPGVLEGPARPSPRRGRSWSTRPWPRRYYLEQNEYVEWPADAGLYDVTVPGQHETGLALPWGGTSHPVWFKRDPRVANVKVLGGVFNRPLMHGRAADRGGRPGADQGPVRRGEVHGAVRAGRRGDEPDAAAGEHRGSTPRWTRSTPPVRSAGRTA